MVPLVFNGASLASFLIEEPSISKLSNSEEEENESEGSDTEKESEKLIENISIWLTIKVGVEGSASLYSFSSNLQAGIHFELTTPPPDKNIFSVFCV